MSYKSLIATINLDSNTLGNVVNDISMLRDNGIDKVIVCDLSIDDATHEENILAIRDIVKHVDVGVYATGNIKRFEDVKKYLYAGCEAVLIDANNDNATEIYNESKARFGLDKLFIYKGDLSQIYRDFEADKPCIITVDNPNDANAYMSDSHILGIMGDFLNDTRFDTLRLKDSLSNAGLSMNVLRPKFKWSDLKISSNGLIPVVVQDYLTNEVLMLAYMNEEAFDTTIKLGKMTYFSRSRNELWIKGDTSGHFQFVKELTTDCDLDTILAKVYQVGVACHTGAYSCFFNEIAKKEYNTKNPMQVLKEVYDVIEDRRINPKEGSYTNYLFDKGIDKILKKVGEEATEIVIASKNAEPMELVYEMSDFLYHAMVLMSEKGIKWEDITEELAKR